MFGQPSGFALAFVAGLTLAPAAIAWAQVPAGAVPSRRLALVGGTLLDGDQAPPIHHAVVLIERNTIVRVGPASVVTLRIPTVIDTSGLTMMPGMIETHAHVYTETEVWDAFRAGIDVLQHMGSAGTPPYSRELIQALVNGGRPVVPTAAHRVFVWPATLDFPERLQHPQLKKDFPPEIDATSRIP